MNRAIGIYSIVNNINGKVYIGQSVNIYKRWKEHINMDSKSLIHRAIQKYGEQNFTFSIIKSISSDSPINRILLNCYECFFIKQYNATNRDKGYNITSGGNQYTISKEACMERSVRLQGHLVSAETRKKIGDKNRGRKRSPEVIAKIRASSLGRKHTAETKRKIAEGQKNRAPISDETRRKIGDASRRRVETDISREHKRQAGKRRKHPELWKPVLCVETGIIYESAFSAGKDVHTNRANITQVCKGTAKTAGGYHWQYSSIPELERYNVKSSTANTRITIETTV
jgi:group I intron endonuclease